MPIRSRAVAAAPSCYAARSAWPCFSASPLAAISSWACSRTTYKATFLSSHLLINRRMSSPLLVTTSGNGSLRKSSATIVQATHLGDAAHTVLQVNWPVRATARTANRDCSVQGRVEWLTSKERLKRSAERLALLVECRCWAVCRCCGYPSPSRACSSCTSAPSASTCSRRRAFSALSAAISSSGVMPLRYTRSASPPEQLLDDEETPCAGRPPAL